MSTIGWLDKENWYIFTIGYYSAIKNNEIFGNKKDSTVNDVETK